MRVVTEQYQEQYQSLPKVSALPRRWAETETKRRSFTAAEEAKLVLLAREEQRLQGLRHKFRREHNRLPTVSEWAAADNNMTIKSLARRREAARAAKRALVEAHSGLVRSLALSYVRRPAIPYSVFDDLVQEGTLGLIHAIGKYDPSKGARLSTYAQPWIRVTMTEWLRRSTVAFEVPKRMVDLSIKADSVADRFQTELGRRPSALEMEKSTGLKSQRVREAKLRTSSAFNALSIEGGEEGDATQMLAHNDETDHLYALRRDLLRALEQSLDDKQMRVVRLRYGLDDGQTRSTRECAALLNISAETVRMTCLRAFRNLRGTPLGNALLDYMD